MKKPALIVFTAMVMAFTLTTQAYPQSEMNRKADHMSLHNEHPDDAYMPAETGGFLTSPAYRNEGQGFWTTQVNVDANGDNILNDAANEPSIAIDPTNPGRMAIGWRQFDNVNNNFRQAGNAYTIDGGLSWQSPGVIEPGVFRSDPVLEADNQGNFYYNSLTSSEGSYFCRVFRSATGGADWDEGTPAQGGDKQWMEIDKTGGDGEGNIYSFWTSYYSVCMPDHFTRSTNGGDSYEDCVTVDGNPYWGTLAVGPSGELYTVGSGFDNGLVVTRSDNAQFSGTPVWWEYYTQVDLDGAMSIGPSVNPVGLLGQASIAVNHAPGPGNGNVYVLSSLARLSSVDPGDVMFARSEDGGLSFGPPVRINDDLSVSNTQWFGTMSVAPNGRIDVVWLDTRDAPSLTPLHSALYYSYSLDQGETWSPNERLSDLFDPHLGWPNQEKMGDYFDMISDNGNAHLAWANTLNGEQDVYYGCITPVITTANDVNTDNPFETLNVSPNPFNDQSRIGFSLTASCDLTIVVCDVSGREVLSVFEGFMDKGTHSIPIDGKHFGKGIYLCRLTAGGVTKTLRLVRYE